MLRGNAEKYLRMLGLFTETHADDVRCLGECLAAGDLATLRARAHVIKGTAGSLGALRLSEAAGRLQEAIVRAAVHEEVERDCVALIDELTAFIAQVRLALKAAER